MKKRSLMLLISLMLVLLLSGCQGKEEASLKMGFVPMRDGDKLIESVEPLAEMLSNELGVKVEAFTATNYVGVVEGLGSGQVDFGFIPPFAYVLAHGESQADVILTALNKKGEKSYCSQFLVAADSEVKSFSDLKGKKIAFVDPSSTSGYLFPGAHLMAQSIDLEKDLEYIYSGGHDKSLQLLMNGDVDAAATFVDCRERYSEDFPEAMDKTKVLGYTDKIPNISVTVNGKMDAEMKTKIQKALLNIAKDEKGATLLKDLFNMYGFAEATDADYEIIRQTAETMNIDLKSVE